LDRVTLNRRTFSAITAVSAMTWLAPSLWAQPHLEKTKVTIAVGGKTSLYYLPLTVAEQLGYFKAEGLDVTLNDFLGGSQALQTLLMGSADVVSGAFEHTISLQSKGQMFKAFVLQGRAPAISIGINRLAVQQYRSVADLKGKTMGISALGSSTHRIAQLILSRAGLKPGDVHFIGVGTAASALTAWRSGQLDALSNVDPVMNLLEQKGELHLIADTRTLKSAVDLFGGAMPAGCLYAPLEFIQKNPNTIQALTNAIVHGLKWLQTAGPGDIIKTVPESYWLGDRAQYLAAFNKMRDAISPDGMFFNEGPRIALKVLASVESGIKPDKIDIGAAYTNDFASHAKALFKA
jgi:NitT/TauT family transport system substrate-binding protein